MPQTLTQKDHSRSALLRKLEVPKNTRAIVYLDIVDRDTHAFLKEAGKYLNIVFMSHGEKVDGEECDACITDGC